MDWGSAFCPLITVLRSVSCQTFYNTKVKIIKESVFHCLVNLFTVRFFVPHHETVRLP